MKFIAFIGWEQVSTGDTVEKAVDNFCEYFGEDLSTGLLNNLQIYALGNKIQCKLDMKVVVLPLKTKTRFPKESS